MASGARSTFQLLFVRDRNSHQDLELELKRLFLGFEFVLAWGRGDGADELGWDLTRSAHPECPAHVHFPKSNGTQPNLESTRHIESFLRPRGLSGVLFYVSTAEPSYLHLFPPLFAS